MSRIDRIKKIFAASKNYRALGENIVCTDGKYYYKTPGIVWKILFYWRMSSHKEIKKSIDLIHEYFWTSCHVVHTQIIKAPEGNYILKQKEIKGELISKKDLDENPVLRGKFEWLMHQSEKMWKEKWYFLDILGTDFFYKPNYIHNLMTNGEELYIFDFWLLDGHSRNIVFRLVSHIMYRFQSAVVHKHFLWDQKYNIFSKILWG